MKVKHITTSIIFQILGITMVEKKIFVFGLAVVLALGTLGFNWVESVLPSELKMKPSTDNPFKLAKP